MNVITVAILGVAVVFMVLALTSAVINVIGQRDKKPFRPF